MKIKNILISQPEQTAENSPYTNLINKYKVSVRFRQFIKVESMSPNDFRKQNVNVLAHTAVVFNSKMGINHFFDMYEKLHLEIPVDMKYFCISEIIANYLQKYVAFRKRRIFFPENNTASNTELMNIILKKHSKDNFFLVLSQDHQSDLPKLLHKAKCKYSQAFFYKTVSSDLSDVNIDDYQLLAFFSPFGIKSLFENFPKFKQNDVVIAAMGSTTAKAVTDAGLRLDISVPTKTALSMPDTIDRYLSAHQEEQ